MSGLREGYKMTELGEIPVEWEVLSLKSVIKEFLVPMRDKPKKFDGNIPWCRIEDIEGKYLSKSLSNQNVSRDVIREMNLKVIPTGSVICSCSARLGICAITKSELTTNQTFIALVPSEKVNNEYLYYLMTSLAPKLQMMSAGTTIAYLSRKNFEDLLIQVPKIEEQQNIASILSSVDGQIDETEQLIMKIKELKKGLMQQLLTKGICHTAFKQTKLGEIPVEWEIKPLKALGTFVKGKGIAKKDLSEQGVPCILYGQLYTKYKEIINNVSSFTEIDIKNPIVGMKNDLLIPSSGETAIDIATASSLNVDNVYIGGDINLYTPISNVDSNFLSFQINSIRKLELAKLAQGSSVYHLYANSLENLQVVLPSLEEQKKIAEILSTVDEQIEEYEQEKEKYEELKKGLMQQLLTGQIRVKI